MEEAAADDNTDSYWHAEVSKADKVRRGKGQSGLVNTTKSSL